MTEPNRKDAASERALSETLNVALRMALPLATLDRDLSRAATKTGVKRFSA